MNDEQANADLANDLELGDGDAGEIVGGSIYGSGRDKAAGESQSGTTLQASSSDVPTQNPLG